nr:group III truncated hemoglobin [Thalassorhabdomicrobium marinisediminis]
MTPLARLPVSEAQIAQVVSRFYASVRAHEELGPIFATHIVDWPAHEEKIVRFWRNALLRERIYDGNPMQVHRAAGNVRPEHFEIWLSVFDETLNAVLPSDLAQVWSAIAHNIGRALRYGLERRATPDGVPVLG